MVEWVLCQWSENGKRRKFVIVAKRVKFKRHDIDSHLRKYFSRVSPKNIKRTKEELQPTRKVRRGSLVTRRIAMSFSTPNANSRVESLRVLCKTTQRLFNFLHIFFIDYQCKQTLKFRNINYIFSRPAFETWKWPCILQLKLIVVCVMWYLSCEKSKRDGQASKKELCEMCLYAF